VNDEGNLSVPKDYSGVWKTWNENGDLIISAEYVNGVGHGWIRNWTPEDGKLVFESYRSYGEFHGPWKSWYKNGKLRNLYYFKNGVPDGICKEWYDNGTPCRIRRMVNGFSVGLHKLFFEDGRVERIEFWDGKGDDDKKNMILIFYVDVTQKYDENEDGNKDESVDYREKYAHLLKETTPTKEHK